MPPKGRQSMPRYGTNFGTVNELTTMQVSYTGFLHDTHDALLVFEACRRDLLPMLSRRLNEEEKHRLVKSGAVFVWDETATGVKRWTDQYAWGECRSYR